MPFSSEITQSERNIPGACAVRECSLGLRGRFFLPKQKGATQMTYCRCDSSFRLLVIVALPVQRAYLHRFKQRFHPTE